MCFAATCGWAQALARPQFVHFEYTEYWPKHSPPRNSASKYSWRSDGRNSGLLGWGHSLRQMELSRRQYQEFLGFPSQEPA